MLGRLARWLRLAGIDCAYAGGIPSDDEVLAQCQRENRLLVTRDAVLVQRAPRNGVEVVGLASREEAEEIAAVARRLGDPLEPARWFTRCPHCNDDLAAVPPAEAQTLLPPSVSPDSGAVRCRGCGQVYWEGSHAPKIRERLEAARALVQTHL